MRGLSALALLAACSFQPTGKASGPADSGAGSATMSDAAVDTAADAAATIDAPPDAAPDAPAQITCPADYTTIAGAPTTSRYKLYSYSSNSTQDQRNDWPTAKSTCMGAHTHLVVVETSAEALALGGALQFASDSPYFWEGVTDEGHENSWQTIFGTPATYLPWAAMQPNGGTQSNCALFDRASLLYDFACNGFQPFACECE